MTTSTTEPRPTGQRITRRAVARGIAWAAPTAVIATAAPAYAASPCATPVNGRINLSYAAGTGTVGGVTLRATSNPVRVRPDANWNLRPTDPSGPGTGWMEITQWPVQTPTSNPTAYQDVTFTFNKPLTDLRFQISDVDKIYDWNPDGYDDRVSLPTVDGQPAGDRVSGSRGSLVAGTGTNGDPWRNTLTRTTGSGLAPTDQRGWVTVSISGEVTLFTIRYWSTATSTFNTQAIWIGNMTYSVCP